MKKLWLALLVALPVFVCANAGKKSFSAPSQLKSPPAAPGFTLRDLTGKPVSLADYKGRIVLLDFWATWCPPCRKSIPALQKLHRDYVSKGVQVVGVNVEEDPAPVQFFIDQIGATYPVLLDSDGRISHVYGVRGIPSLYLIDRKGRLAGHWVGYDLSQESDLRDAIDGLVAQ